MLLKHNMQVVQGRSFPLKSPINKTKKGTPEYTWEGWLGRWPSFRLSQHHHISILQAVIPQGSGEVSKRLFCIKDLQGKTVKY